MAATTIHVSGADATLLVNVPKNHLMPSLLSSERTEVSGEAAVMSHDTKNNATCRAATTAATMAHPLIHLLFVVGMQVVDIDDTQFTGPHHETCGIHAISTVAVGE